MKNRLNLICLLVAVFMLFASCAPNNVDVFTGDETNAPDYYPSDVENESQSETGSEEITDNSETSASDDIENPFIDVNENATSRVVATAATASYRHFCDLADSGYTLSELKKCSYSFKSEEFLNYLSSPATDSFGDAVFKKSIKVSKCLWNKNNYFLKITLCAGESGYTEKNNIVFYIDVSESMWGEKMLPALIKNATAFTDCVGDDDVISILTSAPEGGILLDSVSGDNTDAIINVFENMTVQSGANNHDFLEDAYKLAEKNFISGGGNRVVIISDGDISEKYGQLAADYAKKGIDLKVVGIGPGNYKNEKLQNIASLGDGEYIYIDGEIQAKSFLNNGIFKKNENAAENLICNISFNESIVSKYRLIGYRPENSGNGISDIKPQVIRKGDIITLCYELELTQEAATANEKIADAEITYKPHGTENNVSTGFDITFEKYVENDSEMMLLMCASETLMVLKDSAYAKNIKLSDVYKQLSEMQFEENGRAYEFTKLLGIITGKIKN